MLLGETPRGTIWKDIMVIMQVVLDLRYRWWYIWSYSYDIFYVKNSWTLLRQVS
jgi:hypothetical protein